MINYVVLIIIIVIFNILFIPYAWRKFMKDWETMCKELFAEAGKHMKDVMNLYIESAVEITKEKDVPIFKGVETEDVLVIVDEAIAINVADDKEGKPDLDEIEVDVEEGIKRSQEDNLEDGWVEE